MKKLFAAIAVICLMSVCAYGETAELADIYALQIYGMTRAEIAKGLTIACVVSGLDAQEEEEAWRRIISAELDLDLENAAIARRDVRSLNDAVSMISKGELDVMALPSACARFVASRNETVGYLGDTMYACDMSMVFAADNAGLRESVNQAVADMKQDRTLDILRAFYIDPAADGDDPEPAKISLNDYPETVRVGVSGSLPPYDYICASGEPAGYSAAFLNELSERLRMNVELVTVNGAAFQTQLASGRIDAYFCYFTTGGYGGTDSYYISTGEYTSDISGEKEALADRLIFSDSYARDGFCLLVSRERAESGYQARWDYTIN